MSVVRNPSRQLAAPTKLCLFIIEKIIIMLENISSEVRSATASGIYEIQFILSFVSVSLYRYTINLLILNLLGNVAIT